MEVAVGVLVVVVFGVQGLAHCVLRVALAAISNAEKYGCTLKRATYHTVQCVE